MTDTPITPEEPVRHSYSPYVDREPPDDSHLKAGEVERMAIDARTRHLASCVACQQLTVHYAETRDVVPFEQYPPAE